jgi:hypothetical protein
MNLSEILLTAAHKLHEYYINSKKASNNSGDSIYEHVPYPGHESITEPKLKKCLKRDEKGKCAIPTVATQRAVMTINSSLIMSFHAGKEMTLENVRDFKGHLNVYPIKGKDEYSFDPNAPRLSFKLEKWDKTSNDISRVHLDLENENLSTIFQAMRYEARLWTYGKNTKGEFKSISYMSQKNSIIPRGWLVLYDEARWASYYDRGKIEIGMDDLLFSLQGNYQEGFDLENAIIDHLKDSLRNM